MTYLHKSKIPPIPNFYLILIDLELAATFIIGTHLYARYLCSRALGLGQAHATIGYLVCCIKNYRSKFSLVRCTRRGLTKKIYAFVYIFRKAPSRTWRVREGALRKIYAYVYIFRKAPSRTWRVREGALRKYMLTYIFFVRPLLEHGVYEKVPYKKYMLTYIFFVRPLLERVREGALRARMCALFTSCYFQCLALS